MAVASLAAAAGVAVVVAAAEVAVAAAEVAVAGAAAEIAGTCTPPCRSNSRPWACHNTTAGAVAPYNTVTVP